MVRNSEASPPASVCQIFHVDVLVRAWVLGVTEEATKCKYGVFQFLNQARGVL